MKTLAAAIGCCVLVGALALCTGCGASQEGQLAKAAVLDAMTRVCDYEHDTVKACLERVEAAAKAAEGIAHALAGPPSDAGVAE